MNSWCELFIVICLDCVPVFLRNSLISEVRDESIEHRQGQSIQREIF